MIHLDTSVLIEALTGAKRMAPALRAAIVKGERMGVSTLVLYEWRRGPRLPSELKAQEALLPTDAAVPFDSDAAIRAAHIYQKIPRPRGRELDLAIAACALSHAASFWTLNPDDFGDIPGLELYRA